MTRKLFWQDPYLTEWATRVAATDGPRITLDETIFYAESGGQESDHGSIGEQPVLAARKAGRELIYTLADNHGLHAGDPVTIRIDWPRRYRLMRLHFAAEVLLELFHARFPASEKIGAHIAADKARIDFVHPASIAPLLGELGRAAQDLIAADRPILSGFSDPDAERRYWRVEGFAQVPCGGTHLKRTGEVGTLQLKRKNVGKGKERIEITLADPG